MGVDGVGDDAGGEGLAVGRVGGDAAGLRMQRVGRYEECGGDEEASARHRGNCTGALVWMRGSSFRLVWASAIWDTDGERRPKKPQVPSTSSGQALRLRRKKRRAFRSG